MERAEDMKLRTAVVSLEKLDMGSGAGNGKDTQKGRADAVEDEEQVSDNTPPDSTESNILCTDDDDLEKKIQAFSIPVKKDEKLTNMTSESDSVKSSEKDESLVNTGNSKPPPRQASADKKSGAKQKEKAQISHASSSSELTEDGVSQEQTESIKAKGSIEEKAGINDEKEVENNDTKPVSKKKKHKSSAVKESPKGLLPSSRNAINKRQKNGKEEVSETLSSDVKINQSSSSKEPKQKKTEDNMSLAKRMLRKQTVVKQAEPVDKSISKKDSREGHETISKLQSAVKRKMKHDDGSEVVKQRKVNEKEDCPSSEGIPKTVGKSKVQMNAEVKTVGKTKAQINAEVKTVGKTKAQISAEVKTVGKTKVPVNTEVKTVGKTKAQMNAEVKPKVPTSKKNVNLRGSGLYHARDNYLKTKKPTHSKAGPATLKSRGRNGSERKKPLTESVKTKKPGGESKEKVVGKNMSISKKSVGSAGEKEFSKLKADNTNSRRMRTRETASKKKVRAQQKVDISAGSTDVSEASKVEEQERVKIEKVGRNQKRRLGIVEKTSYSDPKRKEKQPVKKNSKTLVRTAQTHITGTEVSDEENNGMDELGDILEESNSVSEFTFAEKINHHEAQGLHHDSHKFDTVVRETAKEKVFITQLSIFKSSTASKSEKFPLCSNGTVSYKKLWKWSHYIRLPSDLWSVHKHPSGNFVIVLHVPKVSAHCNLIIDKCIVFKENAYPCVKIYGKEVPSLGSENELETLGQVCSFLQCIDDLLLCEGLRSIECNSDCKIYAKEKVPLPFRCESCICK